jgi:hypothetical protein
MSGPAHQAVVQAILDRHQNAKAKGFYAALRRALAEQDPDLELEPHDVCVIPDAFITDSIAKVVTAFEVVVTSGLGARQFVAYSELWWVLDEYEWTLEIVTVDGQGVVVSRTNVQGIAFQRLKLEALRSIEKPSERRIAEIQAIMREFMELNPKMVR